jgi:hypothetical protein
MMIDFVQHPAQRLPEAMSHRFQKAMFALFDREQTLPDRVRLLFPVLGIKWCLIMLNEFLPGYMNRRKAAGAFYGSEKALENQLDKARRRFEAIRRWMDSPGQPFLPDLTITP